MHSLIINIYCPVFFVLTKLLSQNSEKSIHGRGAAADQPDPPALLYEYAININTGY